MEGWRAHRVQALVWLVVSRPPNSRVEISPIMAMSSIGSPTHAMQDDIVVRLV